MRQDRLEKIIMTGMAGSRVGKEEGTQKNGIWTEFKKSLAQHQYEK